MTQSLWFAIFQLVILVLSVSQAGADLIEFPSTLNPVGSGARAMGMGGAFISVADDATAASWNPAGLVQLERPEVSFVYSYFHRTQKYGSDEHPETDSINTMDTDGINYASAAYPFVLFDRNMILSVNYQRLYEMDKRSSFNLRLDDAGVVSSEKHATTQEGFLYALSPAFAVQVVPQLYLGVTVNFWGDYLGENGWVNRQRVTSRGTFGTIRFNGDFRSIDKISFSGTNAHFGFLWMVHPKFTLGGVYKTAFDADLQRKHFQRSILNPWNPPPGSVTEIRDNLTMKMPASYGLGLSCRHSDSWTVALDVYRTEWSRFLMRDENGRETNPLTTNPIEEGRLTDTTQLRLGAEYLIVRDKAVIPLRMGVFYDPEPAKVSPDDFYGISSGFGVVFKKIAVDFAYQYRWGKKVSSDIPNLGISADRSQHTVMLSAIYYF